MANIELSGGILDGAKVDMDALPAALCFEISRNGTEWKPFSPTFALDGSSNINLVIPHRDMEEMIRQGWLLLRIAKR